jgi:phosphonate transport system substrate-binding protein
MGARRVIGVGLLAAGLLATGCGDDGGGEGSLRFAVTDLQGLEELQREFGEFKDALEEATGFDIEFFAVNDRAAAAAALQSDQVDLVFTGPAEYVVLKERLDVTPLVGIARQNYAPCVYAPSDAGFSDVADLAGTKVAMTDLGSTSGHLGPAQMLVDAGLDPGGDVEIVLAGNAVHEALVRGDVDAVGVRCQLVEEFTADDPDAYTLLGRGPDLPPDVIVASSSVSQDVRDAVVAAFEDHWDELRAAMLVGEDNAKYQEADLAVLDDADFDTVRAMYRAIGVDEFDEFVG